MHSINGVGVIFAPLLKSSSSLAPPAGGQQCDNRAVMCSEAPADGALTHTEWFTDLDVISSCAELQFIAFSWVNEHVTGCFWDTDLSFG